MQQGVRPSLVRPIPGGTSPPSTSMATIAKARGPVEWVTRAVARRPRSSPFSMPRADGRPAYDGRSAADIFDALKGGHMLLAHRAYDSDNLSTEMAKGPSWPTSAPCPTVSKQPHAAHRYKTNEMAISGLPSNSRQFESGCEVMSRSPRPLCELFGRQESSRLPCRRSPC